MQGDPAELLPKQKRSFSGAVREAPMGKSYEYDLDRWYEGVEMHMPHTVAQLTVIKSIITEHMKTCRDHEIMGWTWWLKQPFASPESCVDYDGSVAAETPREE